MPDLSIKINLSNEVEITACEWNFWLIRTEDYVHIFPTQGELHKVVGDCWCNPTRIETKILYRNLAGEVLHRVWLVHKEGST